MQPSLTEQIGTPPAANATVDGRDAIIDGTVPRDEPFIADPVTDASVLASLAQAVENEARVRTQANIAKNALTAAHKKTIAAMEFAATHYSESRQLGMELTTGGTDPEEDPE